MEATLLRANSVHGDTAPVRDPSIILQNGQYYLFSTDAANPLPGESLPIRCSSDKVNWNACGQVFTEIPSWVKKAIPGINNLWAPDVSFFEGLYHVYYCASLLHTQISAIGFATNTTLDSSDPKYQWIDHGPVLASRKGDDFNAIDPNILVDTDQRIWLTYGSYWSGIKQREIDGTTGKLLESNSVRYQLAARPETPDHALEGPSLVHHANFYYLFLSEDHCCESSTSEDDYKQIVGRSSGPNGPFLDAKGTSLMLGGGSILLQGNGAWIAPGGGTLYLNSQNGDSLLVFHALNVSEHATASLWLKSVGWQNDWPVLN